MRHLWIATVCVVLAFAAVPSRVYALTEVEPEWTSWGWNSSDALIVLVGWFAEPHNGSPKVVYKNTTNGECNVVELPHDTNETFSGEYSHYKLDDSVEVLAGSGNDKMRFTQSGPSLSCGANTYTIDGILLTEGDLNYHYIDLYGLGGHDHIIEGASTDTCYMWGGSGADTLRAKAEGTTLSGGPDNDNLRSSNIIFITGDWKLLFGDDGNDCMESNDDDEEACEGPWTWVHIDGITGFDIMADEGVDECQSVDNIDYTFSTPPHCGCGHQGDGCSYNSQCCSETCSGGACTAYF